jgi:hypothetical protein
MRDIEKIIDELQEHPDYIDSTIWTRQRALDYIQHEIKWSSELDNIEIDFISVDLTDNMINQAEWDIIYDNIEDALTDINHEIDINLPIKDLICFKQIVRDIKINQIINK